MDDLKNKRSKLSRRRDSGPSLHLHEIFKQQCAASLITFDLSDQQKFSFSGKQDQILDLMQYSFCGIRNKPDLFLAENHLEIFIWTVV